MPSWQVFDGLLLQLMINGWRLIPHLRWYQWQFFGFLNNLQTVYMPTGQQQLVLC